MKIIKLLEYLEKNIDLNEFLKTHQEYSQEELKNIFKNLKKLYLNSLNNEYKLYIDGASRGNPGKAAAGYVIIKNNKEIFRGGKFLGVKTNNEAEYFALLLGLKKCIELNISKIKIFSDSKLLVNQIKGVYKVKNDNLKRFYNEIMKILNNFEFEIEHIPREKNKIADNIANQILDDAI